MEPYGIKIFVEALQDIEDAMYWYEMQSSGLGEKFKRAVMVQIRKLSAYAEIYATRYDDIKCMLVKKYPFMVHYRIDGLAKEIHVYAVFHTSLDPKIWKQRK